MRSFPPTLRLHLFDKVLGRSVLGAVLRKKPLFVPLKTLQQLGQSSLSVALTIASLQKNYHCCINWLEDVMRVLNKRATADLMTTLWNSWINRNNFIFCGKEEEAHVVWERARTLSQDFRIFNLIINPLLPNNSAVKRWEKPPRAVARGKNEMMLAEWAEIYAFEESIKMACALNIKTAVVFETDNASLVNRVKHHSTDVTIISARVKDSIKALENFKSATLCWANRCCNTMANFICKKMSSDSCNWFFDMDYPLEIHELVISDAI
ncbi:hypothetical protein CXB51_004357 [Gossypium anomalum]|uniref:RNase H type-1 domain-containing protein n=1 Tax=Gossypium anomalum TaxID=47600 RepID=A0A8J6DB36_9ROSI|nr:hypothetical protein CXB51_004357 [Gossypium anomalum]